MSRRTTEAAAGTNRSSGRELAAILAAGDHPRIRTRLAGLADGLASIVAEETHRHPEVIVPLAAAFASLRADVLAHLERTDAELLPALSACGSEPDGGEAGSRAALDRAARAVAAGHGVVRASLERLRVVTRSYAPPESAGAEFRALYFGLAALERDLDAGLRSERDLILPVAETLIRTGPGEAAGRARRPARSS